MWVVYSIINSSVKGVSQEGMNILFFIGNLFVPYIVMILVCNEYLNNTSKLLKLLTNALFLYVLIGMLSINIDMLGMGRFMSEKLGNFLPLNIVFLVFFICLRFARKELKFRKVGILLFLLMSIIVLSGTRKALGGAMIIITFTIFSFIKFKSFKANMIVVAFFIVLFFGFQYIMNNTIIGERMNEIEEVGVMFNTTDYAILNRLGDRSYQYIIGWELFVEHPLTGIGLGNFRAITLTKFGIHSEYIVQLAECGLIGTILFLSFNFWILLHLLKCWKKYPQQRYYSWIIVGGGLAILFIGLTAWLYSFPIYFAGYGIIIAFLKQIEGIKLREPVPQVQDYFGRLKLNINQ